MNQTIHVLPYELSSKIAAGEVVQRPASVVKELLENSIDAGASSISVIIEEGGKKSIQVIDDGCGMIGEDAVLAFERHATSKIATYDDLENIKTLGFRGEALASIAAVAHVELRTRRREEDVGTIIRFEGGQLKKSGPEGHQVGTSISVRNLFFNTPGRRNFLKANNTEFKHIFDVVQRVALAAPGLHLKFISEGEIVFDFRSASLEDRLREIFGDNQAGGLVQFRGETENLSVSGFVSRPDFARKTRSDQFLFLNGRFILNRSLNHAVYQAFEHLIEKGSFPVSIVYLKLDPRKVDVNVHPSKMEVKFEDERSIYRLLHAAVRNGLLAHDLIPSVAVTASDVFGGSGKLGFVPSGGAGAWGSVFGIPSLDLNAETTQVGFTLTDPGRNDILTDREEKIPSTPVVLAWQVHNKYIIMPTTDGVMVIDQHAAHERILYDKIIRRMAEGRNDSQQLLFPHTLDLTAGDAALVHELAPVLDAMGFQVKSFGGNTVVVEGVPADVRSGYETTILRDVIDNYRENEHDVRLEPRERLAKSYSCKAAVKAGDPLNVEEIRALLAQLFHTTVPFVCPHGRPVMFKLTLTELDKRFGRMG